MGSFLLLGAKKTTETDFYIFFVFKAQFNQQTSCKHHHHSVIGGRRGGGGVAGGDSISCSAAIIPSSQDPISNIALLCLFY